MEKQEQGVAELSSRQRSQRYLIAGALSALLVSLTWLLFKWNADEVLQHYSFLLFLLSPILQGFIASIIAIKLGLSKLDHKISAGILGTFLMMAAMLAFAVEGVICLMMALPLTILGVLIGSAIAHGISACLEARRAYRIKVSIALAALPAIPLIDSMLIPEPEVHSASTSIIINATPEEIWPYLNNLPNIPAPSEWLFKAGVAHPLSTRTVGSGVGAERHCVLSTGDMPEIITKWEVNRLLEFKVLKTPPSMKELNPFGEVHAGHLEGFYNSRVGRFQLIPLPDGRTKVIGTSIYDHSFGPSWYWSLWTDKIVHDVHLRVLREVKKRAEANR